MKRRLTKTKVNSQFLQATGQAPQEDLLAVSPQGLLPGGQCKGNCTRAHFSKGATFTCDVSRKRWTPPPHFSGPWTQEWEGAETGKGLLAGTGTQPVATGRKAQPCQQGPPTRMSGLTCCSQTSSQLLGSLSPPGTLCCSGSKRRSFPQERPRGGSVSSPGRHRNT